VVNKDPNKKPVIRNKSAERGAKLYVGGIDAGDKTPKGSWTPLTLTDIKNETKRMMKLLYGKD